MRRSLIAGLFACALGLTATVAAQNPQTPAPQTPDKPAATQTEAGKVTVEGCVIREADVPGRQPNVAERAGVGEDYILASAKMIKGSAPKSGAKATGETPTGTAGKLGAMYKIEGVDDDQLKQHVGQRVQIEGTFENVDRAGAPSAEHLVELRGTTIRKVAGDCPAK
jgi:hypothetical protein